MAPMLDPWPSEESCLAQNKMILVCVLHLHWSGDVYPTSCTCLLLGNDVMCLTQLFAATSSALKACEQLADRYTCVHTPASGEKLKASSIHEITFPPATLHAS